MPYDYGNDPTAKQQAAVDVPPWEQAHHMLDKLVEEMRARATNIEQQMQRLDGELNAVRLVLSRIAPSPPQPTTLPDRSPAGYGALGNGPFSR